MPEADWFSANLFASSTNRYEANADATVKLSKRWSTSLLAHYENETKAHDSNDEMCIRDRSSRVYGVCRAKAYASIAFFCCP